MNVDIHRDEELLRESLFLVAKLLRNQNGKFEDTFESLVSNMVCSYCEYSIAKCYTQYCTVILFPHLE